MNVQQDTLVLRSQLLEMSRLSQRAVDYSIKAYELGSPEFCRHARGTEYEIGELHRRLVDRCRKLLAAGPLADSDSRFVESVLRICSALHATCSAATEIARNTMLFLQGGPVQESLALEEMGHLVNRLVRLCTVALFNEEVQHVKAAFDNQGAARLFELAAYHAHNDISREIGTQATFELSITRSLGQIAKQTHEVAEIITVWLEGRDCISAIREHAAHVLRESLPMRRHEEENQILSSVARCLWAGEVQ